MLVRDFYRLHALPVIQPTASNHWRNIIIIIIIIIIIRSRRQQRSVASTQSGHDDEPWTTDHSARMLKGVPSPICWIHEWRGRPGLCSGCHRREMKLIVRPCGETRWPHANSPRIITGRSSKNRLQFWSWLAATEGTDPSKGIVTL